MRPAPPAREAFALAAIALEPAWAAADLRLRTGDERRQAIDADAIGDHRLRLLLRLKLRLLAMLTMAAMLAGLMLVALLVGLSFALMVTRIIVARHERLRLHRDEAGLLPEMRKALAVVVAILRDRFTIGARLRLVLTELFLGCGDQAKIVLGVLVVILGSDRIAGRACVARQLDVFLGDVGCGAADLDIGSVGLEHPGHRVLAAPATIVPVLVIPVAHPLVVLTVSHVLPLFQPLGLFSLKVTIFGRVALECRHHRRARSGTSHAHRIAVQFDSTQISPYVAVDKDALPNSPAIAAGCIKSFRLPKQAQVSRVSFQAQNQAFVRFAVASSAAL
jgi:hypothetical protein